MNEEVVSSIVRGDEAVALLLVEPLDHSLGHVSRPPFFTWAPSKYATHLRRLQHHYSKKDRSPSKEKDPGPFHASEFPRNSFTGSPVSENTPSWQLVNRGNLTTS